MLDITSSEEDHLKFLYQNSIMNRQISKQLGEVEREYFWSGSIYSLHGVANALGLDFKWMNSRKVDFNDYKYSNQI